MPIWVAIELWDFGLLSRFYEGMQKRDRDAIAHMFGAVEGPVLVNWMRMFNFVRNVAAHHSRLWNRTLADPARLPSVDRCLLLKPLHDDETARRKLFAAFTCMRLMLRRIDPRSTWHLRVRDNMATFPDTTLLSLSASGFRPGWDSAPVWH